MSWGGNGNAERKLKARLRAEGRPCHICGMPIDYSCLLYTSDAADE